MTTRAKIQITQGTSIIWGEVGVGAPDVTHQLSFNNFTTNTARMGVVADLGENFEEEYYLYYYVHTGLAPNPLLTSEAYLICSHNGTLWPAKVTGSPGTYTLGVNDANLRPAGSPAITFITTQDASTRLGQAPVIWRPKGRYVAPIVDNNIGQNFANEAVPSNNLSRLILVPKSVVQNDPS